MVWSLVKRAAIKWNADDCLTLGAALAYYTVFSLAPILVIAIAVAGAVFGQEAAQGEIVEQIRGLVGEEGATAIQSLIESAGRQGAGGARHPDRAPGAALRLDQRVQPAPVGAEQDLGGGASRPRPGSGR